MPLYDYSYVDTSRLDTYFAQISDPVVYDKVPIWSVGAKLTGPSVDAKQERPGRPPTIIEKTDKVLEYLIKEKQLGRGRINLSHASQSEEKPFRLEKCRLFPVILPQSNLKLWLSVRDERGAGNRLLLLGNESKGDDDARLSSSYTIFRALAEEGLDLREMLREAGVGPFGELKRLESKLCPEIMPLSGDQKIPLSTDGLGPGYATLMTNSPDFENYMQQSCRSAERIAAELRYDEIEPGLREDVLESEFATDPVCLLMSLGVTVGASSNIETLYRVRQRFRSFSENKKGGHIMITIGYPVFIRF